jgi:hypothetical protein
MIKIAVFLLSAVLAFSLGFWLTQRFYTKPRRQQRSQARFPPPWPSPPPPSLDRQVKELLAQGKTLEAIKRVRQTTHWDLRTSKAYVDGVRRQVLDD